VSGSGDPPGLTPPLEADQPTIRPASAADAELLWGWANDPETRRWSFHSAPIPWETHVAWLDSKLADPAIRIFVVGDGATPKAVVRFEADGEVAVVSVVVDPRARRRGWGVRALRIACPRVVHELMPKRIHAYIKRDNAASMRAFERAGFTPTAETHDADVVLMVWHHGPP
jgi:RimJ/RimL family protein N-acetyltransferase